MAKDPAKPFELSDDDVYEAMKEIEGYLDITPGDFRILYELAYKQAVSRMAQSVKARDLMTRSVMKVKRNTPLLEVARIMAEQSVSGLPVVEIENRVIGVISEKDFVHHMGGGEGLGSFMGIVAHCLSTRECIPLSMHHQRAEDIMTSPPVTVGEDATLSEIANLMREKGINRVPVTDPEGKLAGIVARADIVRMSCAVVIPPEA